jgi:hypothetical protein
VRAVAISPDSRLLVSGDRGGYLFLWELDGEKPYWILFDPGLLKDQTKFKSYDRRDRVGSTVVCTCDLVCTCNTVWLPAGAALPAGAVCVCDTITVGPMKTGSASDRVRSERTVVGSICTCNTISQPSYGGGYSYTISYWYPN